MKGWADGPSADLARQATSPPAQEFQGNQPLQLWDGEQGELWLHLQGPYNNRIPRIHFQVGELLPIILTFYLIFRCSNPGVVEDIMMCLKASFTAAHDAYRRDSVIKEVPIRPTKPSYFLSSRSTSVTPVRWSGSTIFAPTLRASLHQRPKVFSSKELRVSNRLKKKTFWPRWPVLKLRILPSRTRSVAES